MNGPQFGVFITRQPIHTRSCCPWRLQAREWAGVHRLRIGSAQSSLDSMIKLGRCHLKALKDRLELKQKGLDTSHFDRYIPELEAELERERDERTAETEREEKAAKPPKREKRAERAKD